MGLVGPGERGSVTKTVGGGVSCAGPRSSSSLAYSSSSSNSGRGTGGVEDRRRVDFFRDRDFDVRVRIDPAQVFTFFCFFFLTGLFPPAGRDEGLLTCGPASRSGVSSVGSEDLDVQSSEWELSGRSFGEAEPAKGSRPKNDHLFGVLLGLRLAGELEPT